MRGCGLGLLAPKKKSHDHKYVQYYGLDSYVAIELERSQVVTKARGGVVSF